MQLTFEPRVFVYIVSVLLIMGGAAQAIHVILMANEKNRTIALSLAQILYSIIVVIVGLFLLINMSQGFTLGI